MSKHSLTAGTQIQRVTRERLSRVYGHKNRRGLRLHRNHNRVFITYC